MPGRENYTFLVPVQMTADYRSFNIKDHKQVSIIQQ